MSRFCLGTGGFGSDISVVDSHELMDQALDLGINFLDTANVYGGEQGEGLSEQIIGRCLVNHSKESDVLARQPLRLILANEFNRKWSTKCYQGI